MIIVSACLLGENCKYNGGNNKNQAVLAYLKGKEYIAVCPEAMGGLECPRLPAEIVGDKVVKKDGSDVTAFFEKGAQKVADIAQKQGAVLAILKANSPSCGSNFVYDGTFSGTLMPGDGITCKMLKELSIAVKTEQDIEKEQKMC